MMKPIYSSAYFLKSWHALRKQIRLADASHGSRETTSVRCPLTSVDLNRLPFVAPNAEELIVSCHIRSVILLQMSQ